MLPAGRQEKGWHGHADIVDLRAGRVELAQTAAVRVDHVDVAGMRDTIEDPVSTKNTIFDPSGVTPNGAAPASPREAASPASRPEAWAMQSRARYWPGSSHPALEGEDPTVRARRADEEVQGGDRWVGHDWSLPSRSIVRRDHVPCPVSPMVRLFPVGR